MKPKLNLDLNEFYDSRILNDDNVELIFNNETRVDFSILFLMRVFWKLMLDLDKDGTGYNVIDWGIEDYYGFFCDNLDKIDLNQKTYKVYLEELVKYVICDIKSKSKS